MTLLPGAESVYANIMSARTWHEGSGGKTDTCRTDTHDELILGYINPDRRYTLVKIRLNRDLNGG